MTLKLVVLFFTPLLSGLLVYFIPSSKNTNFKLILVFAGSYLFAITVTHILPELYRQHQEVELIGLFVLAGFFLQQLLEYFTSGVEHGHIHTHDHDQEHHHSHNHQSVSALVLLIALCVHAFLEGGIDTGVSHKTQALSPRIRRRRTWRADIAQQGPDPVAFVRLQTPREIANRFFQIVAVFSKQKAASVTGTGHFKE